MVVMVVVMVVLVMMIVLVVAMDSGRSRLIGTRATRGNDRVRFTRASLAHRARDNNVDDDDIDAVSEDFDEDFVNGDISICVFLGFSLHLTDSKQ